MRSPCGSARPLDFMATNDDDLTAKVARLEAELAAARAERLMSTTILETAPVIVLRVSLDFTIEFISRVLPEYSGAPLVGQSVFAFAEVDQHSTMRKALEAARDTRPANELRDRRARARRDPRLVRHHGRPDPRRRRAHRADPHLHQCQQGQAGRGGAEGQPRAARGGARRRPRRAVAMGRHGRRGRVGRPPVRDVRPRPGSGSQAARRLDGARTSRPAGAHVPAHRRGAALGQLPRTTSSPSAPPRTGAGSSCAVDRDAPRTDA
jgi:hypothetical protein